MKIKENIIKLFVLWCNGFIVIFCWIIGIIGAAISAVIGYAIGYFIFDEAILFAFIFYLFALPFTLSLSFKKLYE